jgi:hypothetical protein
MKRGLIFVLLCTVLLGNLLPQTVVKASTIPIIEVTSFQGTPQALLPEVRNSGTIVITVNLGDYDLSSLNEGRVTIRDYDGTETTLSNLWRCQNDKICTWEQYLLFDVEYIYIQTQTPTLWIGSGPWESSYSPFGLHKKEQITQVTFSINDPVYNDWEGLYDPTWEWSVVGSPDWAADQWFEHNKVNIKINTNCNGHGTNHSGLFYWENVPTLPSMFGNGVFRQWVKEPLSPVQWEIKGTIGNWWTQNGETLGPVCWDNLTFLPLVVN